MDEFFTRILDSSSFMPHGHCYLWRPDVLWLNVVSDASIALSYYAIPAFLVYFVSKRKDLVFNWIFVMFALFIVACGTTHIMDIWTVWNPAYGSQGLVKLFTAGVSLATAVALVPLMPKALALPSPKALEEARNELLRLNQELLRVNASLEARVEEKTRDLAGLAAIVEQSNDAIIGRDVNGIISSWNPAAQRLFGFAAEEVIGKSIYDLVPSDRHKELDEVMRRTNNGETTAALDTVRLAKNGRRIDVSVTISPVRDAHGRIIGSSSILRDITVLKKNEARFRHVIEAAPNGLLMVDCDGKIVLCNTVLERLFGYQRDELIGREMDFLVPQRFRGRHPSHRSSFFAAPVARQMGAGRDLFGLRKDGSEVPVEIGLSPMVTEEGTFVLASVVDITKRKNLEVHLRRVVAALQRKNQEMEQFVYTVSHDLKAPVVTSTGFLGLLKEDVAARRYDDVMDSVMRLERANGRMGQLIDDLLQLSRIGRIQLEVEEVDVDHVVKLVCENLSPQIAEKSVRIDIQERMPTISADRKHVYQAFENLLTNALKYGSEGEGPHIAIGFEEVESENRFYVRDNGRGISPEYRQKIFRLFQRLENDNRGTGVGLTIVARIMQMHGGRAWVESSPGAGATFWLAFPKTLPVQEGIDHELSL